jgi:hypothetical protein
MLVNNMDSDSIDTLRDILEYHEAEIEKGSILEMRIRRENRTNETAQKTRTHEEFIEVLDRAIEELDNE